MVEVYAAPSVCLKTTFVFEDCEFALVLVFASSAQRKVSGKILTRLFWYPSEKFARALAKMTYHEMLFGLFDISDSVSQTVTSASLASSPCWCLDPFGSTVISTEGDIVFVTSQKVEILYQWLHLPSYTCC